LSSTTSVAADRGARWTMMVPTMLYRLLDHLAATGEQPPQFETVVYGSAPVAPSRLLEAMDVFGPVLIQLFGQTECPNWGTTLTKRDHAAARSDEALLSSAGRRSVMAAVRIVGDDGQTLPTGQIGEVCLAAPYTMAGYHDNPEATQATLVDGWVHTRDVGLLDERGYLFLKDRTSDMIITGGYNVYSSEVEAVVAAVPGVSQVAVIGIPDADWGESVCAIVVAEPGAQLDTARIREVCRPALGAYKTPKTVHLVQEIPLTPFGKADKKRLRAPFWADQERSI
jgi:fatty-acyl-CoA synthase